MPVVVVTFARPGKYQERERALLREEDALLAAPTSSGSLEPRSGHQRVSALST